MFSRIHPHVIPSFPLKKRFEIRAFGKPSFFFAKFGWKICYGLRARRTPFAVTRS